MSNLIRFVREIQSDYYPCNTEVNADKKGQSMEPIKKKFASEAELENMFSISKSTWRRLRATGKGPSFFKMSNKVLYRIDDVVNWLDGHKRQSTSQYQPHQKGRKPGSKVIQKD